MANENSTEEFKVPEEYLDEPEERKPKKGRRAVKIIAVVVAVCVLIGGAGVCFGLGLFDKEEEPVRYPYILVHGLGGWGASSGINETAHYWGAGTGSLAEYLTGNGYTVVEASVGPFSSVWDRTCELYAQLVGGTVDYGAAHSAAHGHERYGRSYAEPLVSGWGEPDGDGRTVKVNLIGHSFGGPTVRLLTHLLAHGAPEECEGDDASPLFTGGKSGRVNSVTTLCSPNNGSTLYCVLDRYNLTDLVLKLCFSFAGIVGNNPAGFYDFHLEQFGVTQERGSSTDLDVMKDSLAEVFASGKDNAAYDLSPDGAAALNERIELDENAYYFSYYYQTTKPGAISSAQVPKGGTLALLMPTSLLMGAYSGSSEFAYNIDVSWRPNDGLVNVVSARYPFDEEHRDFDAENIAKGIWNVMPQRDGDHGTVIGLNASAAETHEFYDTLLGMIDKLP